MSTNLATAPRPSALLLVALLAPAAAAGDLVVLHAPASHSAFGAAVRAAGDVDGDGWADVIVGARLDDTAGANAGRFRVHNVSGAVVREGFGDPGDELGPSVAGVGDVDGDGHADLAVGAPRHDGAFTNSGRVLVLSGADGHVLHDLAGPGPFDPVFGAAVAGVGDVDADGVPDLAVGATNDQSQGTNLGSARVYSGATGAELHAWHGTASNSQMGAALDGAGDLDGDGHADVVVGSRYGLSSQFQHGRVQVFSGATGLLLRDWQGAQSGQLGSAVSGGSDVDGDGTPDVLAGEPLADAPGSPDAGRVVLWSGAGGVLREGWGEDPDGRLGAAVDLPGDLDGDGTPDQMGAATHAALPATWTGRVDAWSGADGSRLFARAGHGGSFFFGTQVDGLGDANGDGRLDLALGEPNGSAVSTFGFGSVTLCDAQGGTVTSYGAGCHGPLGTDPLLRVFGSLAVNEQQLLLASHVEGATLALVFLGLQPVALPLKGCTLLVDPPLVGFPVVPPGPVSAIALEGFMPPAAAGTVVVMQVWLASGLLPPGQLMATNAVQVTYP